jgi:hypothetical protein
MKYEVYRNKHSSDADFTVIDDMYKRIMSEDKHLCLNAQKNLDAGVFVNGEMHPKMEKGPLFFQKKIREALTAHHTKEQQVNHEIWPAQQVIPKSAVVSQDDVTFCSAVDCCRKNETDEKLDALARRDALATAIVV